MGVRNVFPFNKGPLPTNPSFLRQALSALLNPIHFIGHVTYSVVFLNIFSLDNILTI